MINVKIKKHDVIIITFVGVFSMLLGLILPNGLLLGYGLGISGFTLGLILEENQRRKQNDKKNN